MLRLYQDYYEKNYHRHLTLIEKNFASVLSGVCGGFAGNPCDVILVRQQADKTLPQELRRNYTSFFNGITRVIKEEGIKTLFRGCVPTMCRATAVSLGMNVPYAQTKEILVKYNKTHQETVQIKMIGALIAGTLSTFYALPFDNMKTRLQQMKEINGKLPYKGVSDCILKTIKREGFFKLWVGLPVFYFRCAPHAALMQLAQDWLFKLSKKYVRPQMQRL